MNHLNFYYFIRDFFSLIGSLDIRGFNWINSFALKWVWLDCLAIFFAKYFGYILILFLILFLLKSFRIKWPALIQIFIAPVFSRFIVTEIFRWLWYRPRPFVENSINLLLNHSDVSSFPSGHSAFYFAISIVVYFYNKKIGFLFFLASFLICLSRVFCGIHWPTDILGGILIGIFSGWLIIRFFERWKNM